PQSLSGVLLESSHLKLHRLPFGELARNGYKDLIIAINPGVPENPKIIENIKQMVTEASVYLFDATYRRAYFSDVKILLPITWPPDIKYEIPTLETYEKASVIIADPHVKYGDDPYTLQYGGCGEKGRYIHLTPNFMMHDMVALYGPRSRVFVHEWAHLQWGVFDEYNDLEPFYISQNSTLEATRCSEDIKGKICKGSGCSSCIIDTNTGLPEPDCAFFPDKKQSGSASIMYLQGLPDVVHFCNNETHNSDAPNMQNRMCESRSTWDVIINSEDMKNKLPANPSVSPNKPSFTLLQAKDRALCLVLDVSGSMASENRLDRLRQAAEIFLRQIIEMGSHVGIVTFESAGHIKKHLTIIENNSVRDDLVAALPTGTNGGTNVCAGVDIAFQVRPQTVHGTKGAEVVLLTDGEDDKIRNCFVKVKNSGAVIHTIALGPSAAKELETLSTMTGGLQFSATDNLEVNGLIDTFTGLVSGNGDLTQQAIQLESTGKTVNGKGWFNGTVFIDQTVGNDTFFVITWVTTTIPAIFVHDPNGMIYETVDFKISNVLRTARLQINGTAQPGAWNYNIQNENSGSQVITITATSRAADPKVPPVIVYAYMSKKDTSLPGPMTVYAEVSHGFLPVLFANVTAVVERPSGDPVNLDLLDNGSGADIISHDGIYSRYFTNFSGTGRYNLKVHVQGKEGTMKIAMRRGSYAMYIPGYIENGEIHANPTKPPVGEGDLQPQIGSFSRAKSGGAISLSGNAGGSIDFPPCKITDLKAKFVEDEIHLEWTAPGDNLDQGAAFRYELRMSYSLSELRDQFSSAIEVDLSRLRPHPYGNTEVIQFTPRNIEIQNQTTLYFGIVTHGNSKQPSELSNLARASLILPFAPPVPPVPPVLPGDPIEYPHGVNIAGIMLIVAGAVILVCLIAGVSACSMKRRTFKPRTFILQ
uniref:Chloride channel accessory 1 n=2 Tax=Callorhinchus milii TaxID=7868 RepID=A0A4W3HQ16_CALMI